MSRFEWLEVKGKDKKGKGAGEDHPEEPSGRAFDEEHYLKAAEEKANEGLYEPALRYFSRVLDLDLRVEKAWMGQLLCLIDLGEYQESIAWADKALELFPGSPAVMAAKAVAWGRLGNMDKAKGFSDAALKSGNASSFVWWSRGDILMGENPRNAEYCFRKAMEIDKGSWSLFLRIGKTLLTVGQPMKAKERLIHARNLNPKNPMVWYWLGVAYQHLDLMDKAEGALGKAVELRPGNPEFLEALSELRKTGSLTRAYKRFRRILKGGQK